MSLDTRRCTSVYSGFPVIKGCVDWKRAVPDERLCIDNLILLNAETVPKGTTRLSFGEKVCVYDKAGIRVWVYMGAADRSVTTIEVPFEMVKTWFKQSIKGFNADSPLELHRVYYPLAARRQSGVDKKGNGRQFDRDKFSDSLPDAIRVICAKPRQGKGKIYLEKVGDIVRLRYATQYFQKREMGSIVEKAFLKNKKKLS